MVSLRRFFSRLSRLREEERYEAVMAGGDEDE